MWLREAVIIWVIFGRAPGSVSCLKGETILLMQIGGRNIISNVLTRISRGPSETSGATGGILGPYSARRPVTIQCAVEKRTRTRRIIHCVGETG